MMKKRTQFVVLCAAALFVLYAASLGIFLSYQATVKKEVRQARELPTTDLSGLSFSSYRAGEDFSMMPYADRDSVDSNLFFTFENGVSQSLKEIYDSGEPINSRIVKITTHIYEGNNVTAYYNGEAIPNQKRLEDFLGDSYIEVSIRGKPYLRVYIDHENNLQLTIKVSRRNNYTENGYWHLEALPVDYYDNIVLDNKADGWYVPYNPIFAIWVTVDKLGEGYSIFRTEDTNLAGFSNGQLLFLPFYYFMLLLPVLALVVFRNEKLQLLNTVLPIVYVVWFLGMLFTTRV